MITKYNIEYEKDNVVLIVNLDFNYEMADFDFKGFSKNLKREIEILAKKANAKKIKIIMNGILISTLLLAPLSLENDYNDKTTFITNNTIKDSFNKINLEEKTENETEVIKESNNTEEKNENAEINNNKVSNVTNTINTTTNKNQNTTTKTEPKKEQPTTVVNNTKTNNVTTPTENVKKENTTKEETNKEVDTNTYVTIHRSNGSIVKLELEEYLIGVVSSEMPASFNIEALKAQAVVARTYALKRINENKILTDTTSTQVYKDNTQLKAIWKNDFDKYYTKVKNAVMSTKGLVLMYNNNYIDAVYHSTSNGMTEDSVYVWGYDIPYLKSVESKTDVNVSSYKRETTFSLEKLSTILNTTISKDTTFILERNTSGRVSNVKVNDLEIKGTTFRTLLNLRSTDFTIEISEDTAKITTYGYGHGVGMSQYGANGMANQGYTFKSILSHYYQNVSIKNM